RGWRSYRTCGGGRARFGFGARRRGRRSAGSSCPARATASRLIAPVGGWRVCATVLPASGTTLARALRPPNKENASLFPLLAMPLASAAEPPRPPGLAPDLAPPVHVLAGGQPLDVERSGHAAPCVGDIDCDGKPDLLVGQYDGGKLRIYRNTGTASALKF